MTVQVDSERLKKLRSELPRGYMEKLAAITGLGTTTIYKVLHGHSSNLAVLEAAIVMRDEYQQKKVELINKL